MDAILTKIHALQTLCPNAQWVMEDEKLVWLDKDQPQPSDEEIVAQIELEKQKYKDGEYARNRRKRYPPLGDQLDAILKGFDQLRDSGETLPQDLVGILDEWKNVKAKYPKGENR